jgi:diguanylate cyclase (GGDEF)-like protein
MPSIPRTAEPDLFPLLELAGDGIAVLAPEPWHFVYANPAFIDWLGNPPGGLQDREVAAFLDQLPYSRLLPQIEQVWRQEVAEAEAFVEFQVGTRGPIAAYARLCRLDLGGTPAIGLIMQRRPNSSDVAEHQRRDSLTGLVDREFLFARLAALLHGERSADGQYAVLFVDLDNFKQVNDDHGHLIGDRVLREAARRLSDCVREGDHVVRYGGDEFVVLVEGVSGLDEVDPIIHRIHDALARPIALPEGEVTLSLSIGVAEASPAHQSPEDVLRDADRAMYAAKRANLR